MLFFRAGDPIVPLDALGSGLQLPRDFGDVARRPLGDLDVGERAHLVERAFDDRTDAVYFLEVVLLRSIRGLGLADLKTELIGRPVRPRDHMAAIAMYTECGADFDQTFSETGNFLFLFVHRFGLTCDLQLKRLEFGNPLFKCGNAAVPFLKKVALLRQLREAAISRGELVLEFVHDMPVLGLLLAELDFQPMDPSLRRLQFRHLRTEAVQFEELAVYFSQTSLQSENLLLASCKFLL